MKRTFEECYPEIEAIVEKKRYNWTLKANMMLDFDDVKMIILNQISSGWDTYDQSRPLGAWAATIVKNRFINILRNSYLNTSPPCQRCPCNTSHITGDDSCSLTKSGDQCVECPLYKKWYKSKRFSHDVRLPVPIENHLDEVNERAEQNFNLELSVTRLHDKIKKTLTPSEWEVYRRIYIENKSDREVARELEFETSESNKSPGYKRIKQVKTIILEKAKKILKNGVESLGD